MGIKSLLKWAFRPTTLMNLITEDGINYSRYIVSWYKVGGKISTAEEFDSFCKWLETLGLTRDEIDDIGTMAICGKFELERSAKEFIIKG